MPCLQDERLEDIQLSDDEENGGKPHRRHTSLENLKLTASSVTELRDFFELLSRKNAERECALDFKGVSEPHLISYSAAAGHSYVVVTLLLNV
jgi:hypothetical protein